MDEQLLEAEVMVKSLRVVELRFLLSAMGGYAKGLKKDLVQRATKLLRDNFHPQLFSTIQELYDHRHSTGNANSKRSQIITMRTVVEVAANSPVKSSGPVHDPKVHMSKLPFYQTLETIFSPVSLVRRDGVMKGPWDSIRFFLTTGQSAQIKNCQTKAGLTSVQVVLRICYTESIGVEADQYPPNFFVFVNGQWCPVQAHYSSWNKGLEPSHPCRPINLTPFVKHLAENSVHVIWENTDKFYSLAVYLVNVLCAEDLLEQLKENAVESVESCKQKICEKLRCNPENEITTTGLQVSLICPAWRSLSFILSQTQELFDMGDFKDDVWTLAKMRMSTPCRAQTCAHLQCFDAAFYLQMNERKPSWTCPVCHKPALFDTLQIDGLLSGILQGADEAVKEIEYLSNGSWRAVGKEKECSKTIDLSSLSPENSYMARDVTDLTPCSSDSRDDIEAMEREEIVLPHVKTESVSSKGGMRVK